MSDVRFDVAFDEARDRLTVAFRLILAIPHLIVVGVWAYLAQILAFIQWFVVLFTGKRNRSLWDLQHSWLSYAARVYAYTSLLYDKWPAIGAEPNGEPTRFEFEFEDEADRLTNALRLLWLIPAAIVLWFIGLAAYVLGIVSWFAIVITGRQPRGMFDFLLRAVRAYLRFEAYALLMTDTYPWFRGDEPTSTAAAATSAAPPAPGQPLPPPASF